MSHLLTVKRKDPEKKIVGYIRSIVRARTLCLVKLNDSVRKRSHHTHMSYIETQNNTREKKTHIGRSSRCVNHEYSQRNIVTSYRNIFKCTVRI